MSPCIRISLSLPLWLSALLTYAQPPAFPGAEGFGAAATGGRGGQVIYVTNLNAAGPGSLQAALDIADARYVLFKVSGLIDAEVQLTRGNVTIAGQTSPGGIIVRGFHTTEEPYCDQDCSPPQQFAENWILRHIRTRPGSSGGAFPDGLRLRNTRNAIVDHVSIANATDEAVEISFSNRLSIQNCLIAETLGGHADRGGMLFNYTNPQYGFELDRISVHHNCWNRIAGRMPEVSRESPSAGGTTMRLELSNNLLWDMGYFIDMAHESFPYGGGNSAHVNYQFNWIGNYGFARPDFSYGMLWLPPSLQGGTTTSYFWDNRMNLYPDYSDYQLRYCCNDFPVSEPDVELPDFAVTERHNFPAITYHPSQTLLNYMIANAGAFPRDPMDRRLIAPVSARQIDPERRDINIYNDAYALDFSPESTPPPPLDNDSDGMPDEWERLHDLNPTVQDHNGMDLSAQGYTNLEIYLNELAEKRVAGTRNAAVGWERFQ